MQSQKYWQFCEIQQTILSVSELMKKCVYNMPEVKYSKQDYENPENVWLNSCTLSFCVNLHFWHNSWDTTKYLDKRSVTRKSEWRNAQIHIIRWVYTLNVIVNTGPVMRNLSPLFRFKLVALLFLPILIYCLLHTWMTATCIS